MSEDFYAADDLGIEPEVLEYISSQKSYDLDSHVARQAMVELVKNHRLDFLLLRDDKVSKWWGSKTQEARNVIERRRERERVKRIKMEAIAKLTDAERIALGIRKPTVKS